MAERPRNRTSTAASRKRRRLFRDPGPSPTEALAALARAWMVTTIATALLLAALAIAPVWDGAIFMQGLRDTLSGDPSLTQPIDEPLPGAPVDRETPGMPAGGWPVKAIALKHAVSRQSSTGFLLARP